MHCFSPQIETERLFMEKNIKLKGLNIAYSETGKEDGNPVILMHGWGCDSGTVNSIARILEPGYKVYNFDLPGHGKSDEPNDLPDGQPWGVEEFAELIEEFIEKMRLEKPSLIGHSYGGRVSIVLASRNDVSRLVLVDSAGIKPKRPLKYYLKVYSFKCAKKIFPIILGKKRGEKALNAWRGKAGSSDYRRASAMMRRVMSKSVNQDLRHLMPGIKAPTLLIWGEKDTATPLSDAKQMERLIPDAGLVTFPGCGHYSFLDNPGQFRAVLKSFFKLV